MVKSLDNKHKEMMESDPQYAKAYVGMEEEFQFARELIRARIRSGLTRQQVVETVHYCQTGIREYTSQPQKFAKICPGYR